MQPLEWGLSSAEYELAARILSGPYTGFWLVRTPLSTNKGFIGYPDVFSDFAIFVGVVGLNPPGNFPWGYDVSPD